jgi:hypothetical protein
MLCVSGVGRRFDLVGRSDADFQRELWLCRVRHAGYALFAIALFCLSSGAAEASVAFPVVRTGMDYLALCGQLLLVGQVTWLLRSNPLGAFKPLRHDQLIGELAAYLEHSPLARAYVERIRQDGRRLHGIDLEEVRRRAELDQQYLHRHHAEPGVRLAAWMLQP